VSAPRRARGGGGELLQAAPLTVALIAANVVTYIVEKGDATPTVVNSGTTGGSLAAEGSLDAHLILWGPMVAAGEWWRLLTCGFLHANPLHLGTNMLSLFFIGRLVEPAIGTLRTGLIYLVSLAAGSLGVMVLEPGGATLGASGAIFGLAGALLVIAHIRGAGVMQTGIGPMILLNLAFTFSIPGISVGGHVGGLLGGAALGYAILEIDKRRRPREAGDARVAAVAAAAFVAMLVISFAIARSKYPSLG
jgi:membrane associated rhomboid family serine protease